MIRLAHISDIHLGPLPPVTVSDLASKRITGYVNWKRNRAHRMMDNTLDALIDAMVHKQPDHIAVTGDLVNLALEAEIKTARLWLEALGRPQTVSVVPGNHDAYVPGALNRVLKSWAPWMYGDSHSGAGVATFPYVRRREGVALIGVTSAEATAPFMAHGYFRGPQARRTGELLDETGKEGLARVVMIHHPPVRQATPMHKRLYGIGRFQRMIAEHGAELILHGHTPLPTLHWIKGRDGRVPVVGVSAASQGLDGHRPPGAFNLLEISAGDNGTSITLERHALAHVTGRVERVERTDLTELREEAPALSE